MKIYYIEINGQQSEALSFEELKNQNISKDTLVWFEGLAGWSKAGSIDELAELFKSIPPPIQKASPQPLRQEIPEEEKQSFLSNSTNRILLGAFSIILFAVLIFSFSDKAQVDTQNATEQNTLLIQQQQQQLEEQKAKIAKQENIEKERAERERKAAKEKRISELTQQIFIAHQDVENAKKKVNDATAFQLLRSSGERNKDINTASETLSTRQNELETLQKEMKGLDPDYQY